MDRVTTNKARNKETSKRPMIASTFSKSGGNGGGVGLNERN